MRTTSLVILSVMAVSLVSCGSGVTSVFSNRLTKPDGTTLYLEELREVAGNPENDADDLRALGIEDDALIEALLAYYQ